MPLMLGTRLGPYEIVSSLGAGGMGEVYRAKDTRLDRTVAIKILAEHFSKDPTRKQRFEREAKAISGLNHPNICILHDVGSQNGTDYLVMEYVDGESLAHRLAKGPLPIDQVLKVGREIADALDRAHHSGIIHRDLKPGNIMLTKIGAKLLDFGLARPTSSSASIATLSGTAVSQAPVTQEGTIVGTFQYMSPEQVEGKDLDGRSDIFSLGAVLYEMVTGRRAFEGKSQLSVASAILEKEPAPITTLKPLSPPSLDHIIRRCLAKNPDDRWQSARDVALELGSASPIDKLAPGTHGLGTRLGKKVSHWVAWSLAATSFAALAFVLIRPSQTPPSNQQIIRSLILAPDGEAFDQWSWTTISPDGKNLVFSAAAPGYGGKLWIRPLDSLTAKPLPGTDGAINPFWSPDSKWIAFNAGSKLRKMSIDSGTVLDICEAANMRGGSWGTSDSILFVSGVGVPVSMVPASGGVPVAVTELDKSNGELTHRYPVFLPDSEHFLFFSRGKENAIYVSSLHSRERKLVLRNDTNAVFVAPGYLLFVRGGVLMAQRFDVNKLELVGNATPIAEGVPVFAAHQHALFSASENGVIAIQSKVQLLTQPAWVDFSGKVTETISEPAMFDYYGFRVAPNGEKIAFVIADPTDGSDNIWIHDRASRQRTRLTFEKLLAQNPVWSADSSRIIFNSNRLGNPKLFSIPATGVGDAELFLPSDQNDAARASSPDGKYLVFTRTPPEKMLDHSLWLLPLSGEKKPYPMLKTAHSHQWGASFSPDGKWIAYPSDESGKTEVYAVPFPEAQLKIQISKDGGWEPHWSRDGREIYFLAKGGTLTAASLRYVNGVPQVAATRSLFKLTIPSFDVSVDAKHFLVLKVVDNQEPSSITLVSNWPGLLNR
jgi:eukaryotic-like serine/threonine-protein kinase